jgi:O-antigen/teichoic acid export membrane protein
MALLIPRYGAVGAASGLSLGYTILAAGVLYLVKSIRQQPARRWWATIQNSTAAVTAPASTELRRAAVRAQ